MARIVGIDIPRNKKIVFSLCYIHGIGTTTALKICEMAKVDKEKRIVLLQERGEDVSDIEMVDEGVIEDELAPVGVGGLLLRPGSLGGAAAGFAPTVAVKLVSCVPRRLRAPDILREHFRGRDGAALRAELEAQALEETPPPPQERTSEQSVQPESETLFY